MASFMKEIVLVTLAIDTETGEIDPKAPFMVNSRRRGTRYNRPYHDEPASSSNSVRASGRREAEWTDEGWKFGKRVTDA